MAAAGGVWGRVPARHRFCVGTIGLILRMVIVAATSFRGAAAMLRLCGPHWPYAGGIPCWSSGRWWLLRVGLFELCREKPRADDWVWMMDHTIQLGPWECLVALGAIVGKKSDVILAQALQTIRTQDVVTWCRNALGPTIASQRRLALGVTKPG